MAVDLSVANSMIAAFEAGRRIKEGKIQRETEEKRRQEDLALAEQKRKDDLKKAEQDYKLRQEERAALDAVRRSVERRAIAEEYRTTGEASGAAVRPGVAKIGTGQNVNVPSPDNVSPFQGGAALPEVGPVIKNEVDPNRSRLVHPEFGEIDTLTPQAYANLVAKQDEITQGPKRKEAEALKQLELKARADEKETEWRYRNEQTEANNKLRLEIAKLNNASKEEIAALRAEMQENKLLTPAEAELFDVPYGTNRADVFGKNPGVKMTAAQSADLADLDDLEKQLMSIQDAFTPTKGGIPYSEYFQGGFSIQDEAARKFGLPRNAKFQEVSPKIAEYNAKVAVSRGGTSFTPNEEALLKSYAIDPSHRNDPGDQEAKINSALKNIRQLRAAKLAQFSGRVLNRNAPSSTNGVPGTAIEYIRDANGKLVRAGVQQ